MVLNGIKVYRYFKIHRGKQIIDTSEKRSVTLGRKFGHLAVVVDDI